MPIHLIWSEHNSRESWLIYCIWESLQTKNRFVLCMQHQPLDFKNCSTACTLSCLCNWISQHTRSNAHALLTHVPLTCQCQSQQAEANQASIPNIGNMQPFLCKIAKCATEFAGLDMHPPPEFPNTSQHASGMQSRLCLSGCRPGSCQSRTAPQGWWLRWSWYAQRKDPAP